MSQIEFIYQKEDQKSVTDLLDKYYNSLPLLVVVTEGFHEKRDEFTFCPGQVLRLHTLKTQQRVVLQAEDKCYTVPLEYPVAFHVVKSKVPPHTQPVDNIRKNMTLKEIISRYPFPINVCFSDPEEYIDCLNCNHPQRIAQSTLQVVAVHEQAYFLVSTVLPDSGMPLQAVTPLPLYLYEVKFSIVTGLRKGSRHKDLQTLLRQQAQFLSRVNFDLDYSDKGMVQLLEKPRNPSEDIYQNLDEDVYVNAGTLPSETMPPPLPKRRMSHQSESPENVVAAATSTPPNIPPSPSTSSLDVYEPIENITPRPLKSHPSATPKDKHQEQTGVDDDDSDSDLYEIHDDKKEEQRDTGKEGTRFSGNSTSGVDPNAVQLRPPVAHKPSHIPKREGSVGFSSVLTMTPELQQKLEKQKAHIEGNDSNSSKKVAKMKPVEPPGTKRSGSGTLPSAITPKPRSPVSSVSPTVSSPSQRSAPAQTASTKATVYEDAATVSNGHKMPVNITKNAPDKEDTRDMTGKSEVHDVVKRASQPSSETKPDQVPPSTTATTPTRNCSTSVTTVPTPITDRDSAQLYVNEQEMARVKPMPNTSFDSVPEKVQTETLPAQLYVNEQEMARVKPMPNTSVDSVPEKVQTETLPATKPRLALDQTSKRQMSPQFAGTPELETMTIEDVQKMLRHLGLESHGARFKEEKVDGVILEKLDDETLREDFGLSRTEVIRLKAFVEKGHIPQ